ncbi:MAG: ribonuclease PH [Candidatus Aureabacteria bacterium]|nr:ribonuclease PH [Candidatus Auribacterota bacterium]
MKRKDGRAAGDLRQVKITGDYVKYPLGSVLVEFGDTRVICAATMDEEQPRWMREQKRQGGWLTCEYSMMPFCSPERAVREATRGKIGGRTHEIQRMIGRALRAVLDLKALGPRTLWIDCEVLQADGGTRTAAITGGYLALKRAVMRMMEQGVLMQNPLREALAAVSVGKVEGGLLLDLNYEEDCRAEVDMNVVMTEGGKFIEVQATAESGPFTTEEMHGMIALARQGIGALIEAQKRVWGARR